MKSLNPKLIWLIYIFALILIASAFFGEHTNFIMVLSVGTLFMLIAWIAVLFSIVGNPRINKAGWILFLFFFGLVAIPAYLLGKAGN